MAGSCSSPTRRPSCSTASRPGARPKSGAPDPVWSRATPRRPRAPLGELRERRHLGELRWREFLPENAGWFFVAPASSDHALRGDDDVEGNVVSRHRNRVVDDLELVDRGDDGRRLLDDTHRARERELEVAVASAFAEPRTRGVDGDAAGHDQI